MMQMLWLWLRLATFLELIETPEDFNEGSTAAAEDEANTEAATATAVINALSMQHAACNRTETELATVVFAWPFQVNKQRGGSQRAIHNNDGHNAQLLLHSCCYCCSCMWHVASSTRTLECCRTSVAKYLANMA